MKNQHKKINVSKVKRLAASKQHQIKQLEFDIDPDRGAAATFGMCALKGYRLVEMRRTNRKVICKYEKITIKKK